MSMRSSYQVGFKNLMSTYFQFDGKVKDILENGTRSKHLYYPLICINKDMTVQVILYTYLLSPSFSRKIRKIISNVFSR